MNLHPCPRARHGALFVSLPRSNIGSQWVPRCQRLAGGWAPCRVVPFDGSSAGRQVGPAGECRSAAWSPDGRWMYFSAQVDGESHLWRQRFPNGAPEPLTSGSTTEEEGVAVAPDGGSLITSLGRRQSSVWLQDSRGERLLSAEDSRLIRVSRRMAGASTTCYDEPLPGHRRADHDRYRVRQDRNELPDFSVLDYDISRDERQVVFATVGADGERQVWIASLDRRSAPRQIARHADQARSPRGRIVFRSVEGHVNFIDRIKADGTTRQRVTNEPIVDFRDVSPDGRWLVTMSSRSNNQPRTRCFPLTADRRV